MRSPLAHAMGLGSAREGVEHWWMERVSAVALVPLTMWFVAAIIAHTGSDYASFIAWLSPLLSHRTWAAGRDRGLRPLRG
jgi:succinate dehydrogenase / fumarate reductase membrane anchor subunit